MKTQKELKCIIDFPVQKSVDGTHCTDIRLLSRPCRQAGVIDSIERFWVSVFYERQTSLVRPTTKTPTTPTKRRRQQLPNCWGKTSSYVDKLGEATL